MYFHMPSHWLKSFVVSSVCLASLPIILPCLVSGSLNIPIHTHRLGAQRTGTLHLRKKAGALAGKQTQKDNAEKTNTEKTNTERQKGRQQTQKDNTHAEELRKLFTETDEDNTGTMSYDEFQRLMRHPKFRSYLEVRGIQSYTSKGVGRQGIGSFERDSYVSTLCPVVICP